MKIYTRTGDSGETGLYGGERVSKDSLRITAVGTVDESNAILGVAALDIVDAELAGVVSRIQAELLVVGADIGSPLSLGDVVPRTIPSMTTRLEEEMDRWDAELPALRNFILPGGSRAGAQVHLARSVARRAERCIVSLAAVEPLSPEVLRYVNRLSDHLFVLARVVNHRSGTPEPVWERPRSRNPER
ncbi:MAG: cob(I)yrinic acid a,c-diamide adenosyltransferase [Capsulimonadaceae bacterium]